MWTDSIRNGGFEQTPVLAAQGGPWMPATGFESAFSVDATVARTGTHSMKMYGVAGAEAYEIFHLPAGVYKLTGYIKTSSGGTGRARLMLDFRRGRYESVSPSCTEDCGINLWYTSQEISAGAGWTQVSITFNVTADNIRDAKPNANFPDTIKTFAVLDGFWAGARLAAWYDDVQLLQQPNFPLDVFMRYPNRRGMLFADQDQTLRFHVTPLTAYANGGYTVRATLRMEGGNGFLETTDAPLTNLTVDSDTGKPGVEIALNTGSSLASVADYQPVLAEFRLLDSSLNEVNSALRYPAYRVYKVPATVKPMMNVSANPQNQVVLGLPRPNVALQPPIPPVPRFILGVYDSGLGSVDATTDWEQVLFSPSGARRMNDFPINLYLNYHLGATGADTINNLMTTLGKHNIAYLQTGNCFSSTAAGSAFKVEQPGADGSYPYITQSPPAGIGQMVGGYYTADECTADMIDGAFAQYQRLERLDPDSMTFGALLPNTDLPLWRDSIDVMSSDPYPMFGAEPVGGYDHGFVARGTSMTARAVQHSRPFITVLQFFKFDASRSSQGRWPTQTEMRNHAYMAIVQGAKGLMWWSLGENALTSACGTPKTWCADRTQHMNDLKAVVRDLAALESVLLEDDTTQSWGGVSSVTVNGAALASTTIPTKVKRDDTSTTSHTDYVFAYNSTPYYNANVATPSARVEFTLPPLASPKSIAVYGENRTIPVPKDAKNAFSDDFGPFGAHVYVISY